MMASEKGGCVNAVGSISTAEHARCMNKTLGRPPLIIELVKNTRTKKMRDFDDERTLKAFEVYQTLLVNILIQNPQYTPAEGEPIHRDVDFFILDQVIGGKGPNSCFFGGGNLTSTLRSEDITLFQRVGDGEGGSRQPNLTPEQLETVRQLTLNETRRKSVQREAAMKTQMETMRQEQQRKMEVMAKRQADMELQMRQFMQRFGGNQNVRGQEPKDDRNEDNFDIDNYPNQDDP